PSTIKPNPTDKSSATEVHSNGKNDAPSTLSTPSTQSASSSDPSTIKPSPTDKSSASEVHSNGKNDAPSTLSTPPTQSVSSSDPSTIKPNPTDKSSATEVHSNGKNDAPSTLSTPSTQTASSSDPSAIKPSPADKSSASEVHSNGKNDASTTLSAQSVQSTPSTPSTPSTTIYSHFNPTANIPLPLRTNTQKSNNPMPTDYPSKIVTSDSSGSVPQDNSQLSLSLSPALAWESVVQDSTIPAAMTAQIKNDIANSLKISPDDVKILSIQCGDNGGVKVNIAIPSKYNNEFINLVNNKDSSLHHQSEFSQLYDSVEDDNSSSNSNNGKFVNANSGGSSNSGLIVGAVFGSAFLYVGATILAVRTYRKRKANSVNMDVERNWGSQSY
ncbi:28936_t:CDS:2, partial [Gigaspora margarita]